jgi:lysozyme family protein
MKENFEIALQALLKHEGGFVNHPRDPGGMTNLGVTKKVWEAFVGREVTEDEMRALTPATVAPLYKQRYWDAVHGDTLPSGVDYCVFDCAVNSGVKQSVRFLQRAVQAEPDGLLGPNTLQAVAAADPMDVIEKFTTAREGFLKGLPTFVTFGKGWLIRTASVEKQAADLA